jgi:hypothetical protein
MEISLLKISQGYRALSDRGFGAIRAVILVGNNLKSIEPTIA